MAVQKYTFASHHWVGSNYMKPSDYMEFDTDTRIATLYPGMVDKQLLNLDPVVVTALASNGVIVTTVTTPSPLPAHGV